MVKWLEKGIPSCRGHSPCRAHSVGSRTQDAVGPFLPLCSGAFLFRGKSAQPYSKTHPMAAIILIPILIIIIFWGGIISLGHSPHLSYPHKSERRVLLGKWELNGLNPTAVKAIKAKCEHRPSLIQALYFCWGIVVCLMHLFFLIWPVWVTKLPAII